MPFASSAPPPTAPASLAYRETPSASLATGTNTDPFLLSPVLNLPPSFGSAYVGELFACTLCVNHDVPIGVDVEGGVTVPRRAIRDVRIEAEMKTPSTTGVVKLELTTGGGSEQDSLGANALTVTIGSGGVDLEVGQTLQKVVRFDLKEEGNHVLAVTVSYYEVTDTSGRTRTFRKLYQFICKSSLIVRTKAGPYAAATMPPATGAPASSKDGTTTPFRRWVLEAQLENCGEDAMQLDRVTLQLEPALAYQDCNDWDDSTDSETDISPPGRSLSSHSRRPVLHPGEVEQVSFLIEETEPGLQEQGNGRLVFGVLDIGWRGEMGNRGSLSTGKLGVRTSR